METFKNKTVFVTGAAEGIGRGICQAFAGAGATVGLNDIDPVLADKAALELNKKLGRNSVHAFPADMGTPEAIDSMLASFTEQIGPPDIAIANAGITRHLAFLETTPEIFDRIVAVNQRGSYFFAQAVARAMIATQKPGRILLMSSAVGLQTHPNFSVYAMTKAALQMLAKSLALELGSHGITVNAISPGATLTPRVLEDDPAYAENWAAVNLTGRAGSVDDIAAAALYLASDAAGQITGHNLVIDGGWSIRGTMPEKDLEKDRSIPSELTSSSTRNH